jgi:autotransporter-associated beta strand protein
LVKSGASKWILSSANSFTGGVAINNDAAGSAGTLVMGHANALSAANAVTFGAAAVGGLSLNGNSVTIGGLSTNATAGTTMVSNDSATPATLTVSNAAANAFAGSILDGAAGALSLTKSGAGTLTLSGFNTYTGSTTINQGTLAMGNSNVIPTTSNLILGGGTLATGGFPQTMGTLRLNASSNIDMAPLGASANVQFANSAAVPWTAGALLGIFNWDGVPTTGNGGDQLQIGTSASLTAAQLSQIDFAGYSGTTVQLATGEVVPNGTPLLFGDLNTDGSVSADDIGAMIQALTNPTAYKAAHPGFTDADIAAIGDFNQNLSLNNADLEGMLTFLKTFPPAGGGSAAPVPEPGSVVLLGLGGVVLLAGAVRRRAKQRLIAYGSTE